MTDKKKVVDAPIPDKSDTDKELQQLVTSIPDPLLRTYASALLLINDVGSEEARLNAIGDGMLTDMML
jgi:hypothetical protein